MAGKLAPPGSSFYRSPLVILYSNRWLGNSVRSSERLPIENGIDIYIYNLIYIYIYIRNYMNILGNMDEYGTHMGPQTLLITG